MIDKKRMAINTRTYWMLGLVAVIAMVAGVGATVAPEAANSRVAPGQIDDGAELLDQATITLEEAIAAAQAAESGVLGEVDLEMYQDRLVFNIDIGEKDVKVDAADATVLGWVSDD